MTNPSDTSTETEDSALPTPPLAGRPKLLLFYALFFWWFIELLVSRLFWLKDSGSFSKTGFLALAGIAGLIGLLWLRRFAHRFRRAGLMGGVAIFCLWSPRGSLRLSELGNLPFIKWLVLLGLGYLVFDLLYQLSVRPYEEAVRELDPKAYQKAVARGFKRLAWIVGVFALLEAWAVFHPTIYRVVLASLQPDFKTFVEANERWRKMDPEKHPLWVRTVKDNDPRTPNYRGVPNLNLAYELDDAALKLLKEQGGQRELMHNSLGFQSPEPVMPKTGGTYRVFCVGGSTTEQGGLLKSYPALMQTSLNSNGFPRVRCFVNGMFGYASYENLLRFEEYLSYEPDLILVYHGINELYHIDLQPHPATRLLGSHFLGWLRNTLTADNRHWKKIEKQIQNQTIRHFELMIDDAQKAGSRIAFIGFVTPDFKALPLKERIYFKTLITYRVRRCRSPRSYARFIQILNRECRALCEERQVPYLDAPGHFKGRGSDFIYDACHRTEAANLEWAEWVAASCREKGLLTRPTQKTEKESTPNKFP